MVMVLSAILTNDLLSTRQLHSITRYSFYLLNIRKLQQLFDQVQDQRILISFVFNFQQIDQAIMESK